MRLKEIIINTLACAITFGSLGGATLGALGASGAFGIREEKEICNFHWNGKPATLKRVDRRLARDTYHILLEEQYKIGKIKKPIVADEGYKISLLGYFGGRVAFGYDISKIE